MRSSRIALLAALLCSITVLAAAQAKPGVLNNDEIKHLVPSSYFFAGQSASVQIRNSSGFRTTNNKLVLVGLVDTSGYASDIQQKYQGLLITETKLKIGDAEVSPGQYGFGFLKDGKFVILDVTASEIGAATSTRDDQMARPVPLKVVADGDAYKLYAGKNWVSMKPE